MTPGAQQVERRKTSWKQRGCLILFGLALLLLPELLLRLAGLGGSPPLLRALPFTPQTFRGVETPAGTQLYEIHPRVADIFFARQTPGGDRLAGGHGRELLLLPKSPGTYRVLFAGASSVEGFPMPRNLTAARILEAWLQQSMPEQQVEVINLGVAAVASFPVRKLAERAVDELDADLLLVYAGHNEFYGAGGVASYQFMGHHPWSMEGAYRLRRSAMVQLAEAVLRPDQDEVAATADREQLIQVMAAIDQVEPEGELHATARRNLEHNIRALVRHARSRDVPVVVGTLVSNERGMAPLASWGESDLDASRHYQRALDAQASGSDSGQEQSDELFKRARDLDAMPWRAARDKNEMLRSLAEAEAVSLADCEATFARAAEQQGGSSATDWRHFADHVHPSLAGQALLARCFLDAIAPPAGQVSPRPALAPWPDLAAQLGAHPLELFLLAHKMATLFREPPMNRNNEAVTEMTANWVRDLRAGADAVDQDGIRRWEEASRIAGQSLPISFFGAVASLEAADLDRARTYLRAAIGNAPPYSDPRCAARLLLLATERAILRQSDDLSSSAAPASRAAWQQELEQARAEAGYVRLLTSEPSALLRRVTLELDLLGEQGRLAEPSGQRAEPTNLSESPATPGLEDLSGPQRAWLIALQDGLQALASLQEAERPVAE